jgi:hypothetical protein
MSGAGQVGSTATNPVGQYDVPYVRTPEDQKLGHKIIASTNGTAKRISGFFSTIRQKITGAFKLIFCQPSQRQRAKTSLEQRNEAAKKGSNLLDSANEKVSAASKKMDDFLKDSRTVEFTPKQKEAITKSIEDDINAAKTSSEQAKNIIDTNNAILNAIIGAFSKKNHKYFSKAPGHVTKISDEIQSISDKINKVETTFKQFSKDIKHKARPYGGEGADSQVQYTKNQAELVMANDITKKINDKLDPSVINAEIPMSSLNLSGAQSKYILRVLSEGIVNTESKLKQNDVLKTDQAKMLKSLENELKKLNKNLEPLHLGLEKHLAEMNEKLEPKLTHLQFRQKHNLLNPDEKDLVKAQETVVNQVKEQKEYGGQLDETEKSLKGTQKDLEDILKKFSTSTVSNLTLKDLTKLSDIFKKVAAVTEKNIKTEENVQRNMPLFHKKLMENGAHPTNPGSVQEAPGKLLGKETPATAAELSQTASAELLQKALAELSPEAMAKLLKTLAELSPKTAAESATAA